MQDHLSSTETALEYIAKVTSKFSTLVCRIHDFLLPNYIQVKLDLHYSVRTVNFLYAQKLNEKKTTTTTAAAASP